MQINPNNSWHIYCSNLEPNEKINFTCAVQFNYNNGTNKKIRDHILYIFNNSTWLWSGNYPKLFENISYIFINNMVKLKINTINPPKAKVFINGSYCGTTPLKGYILSGIYNITFNESNYLNFSICRKISNISEGIIEIENLTRIPCRLILNIISPDTSTVYLDGVEIDKRNVTIEQGHVYNLLIVAPGFISQEQTILAPNNISYNLTPIKLIRNHFSLSGSLWLTGNYLNENPTAFLTILIVVIAIFAIILVAYCRKIKLCPNNSTLSESLGIAICQVDKFSGALLVVLTIILIILTLILIIVAIIALLK